MKIKSIDIEGMYSYNKKQTIVLDDKNFLVGHNNSGKSSVFKAINFFIDSMANEYGLEKQWKRQSEHKMTLRISLNNSERRYLVELLTISKPDKNLILADVDIVEFLIGKFKNVNISIEWDVQPYSNTARLKNFEMKILELDIKITYNENHSTYIHKFGTDIRGSVSYKNTFISVIEKIGIKQFTKNAFLNALDSHYSVVDFSHIGLFQDNKNYNIANRINFITELANKSVRANMQISFLSMLGYLFKQKISFISEKRQFEIENELEKLPLSDDGKNLHSYLYWLHNSEDIKNNILYRKIQEGFSKIMNDENLLFNTILNEKIKQSVDGERSIHPGSVSIIFRNNDDQANTIKFMESGSGVREVLFLLTKYFGMEQSIIFMDEPAINLHPTLIKKLMLEIFSKDNEQNQIVIATHSPVVLSGTKLLHTSNIIRIFKNKTSIIVQPSKKEKKWIIDKMSIFHLLKLDVLFAKGVILVEGTSDEIFFSAILDKIRESGCYVDDIMIVNCGGSKSIKKFIKFMNIFKIPFLILIDENAPGEFKEKEITKFSSDLMTNVQDFHGENITYALDGDLENYMMSLNKPLYDKIKDRFGTKPAIAYNFIEKLEDKNKLTRFYHMIKHLKYIIENNSTAP